LKKDIADIHYDLPNNYNACTETTMAAVTADTNNHISGLTYDPSGNTLTDGTNTYTWNGERRVAQAFRGFECHSNSEMMGGDTANASVARSVV
jgi:hypothetical protein